jgi:hypothetical protein
MREQIPEQSLTIRSLLRMLGPLRRWNGHRSAEL